MPELPEVELAKRWLNNNFVPEVISDARMFSLSALKTYDPPLESLIGKSISEWGRVGKFLWAKADDVFFAVHFSRAGWLKFSEVALTNTKPARKSPLACRLTFKSGSAIEFYEAGHEKRLAIHVVRSLDDIEYIATLGPDVYDASFTRDVFAGLLNSGERIKNLLVDQRRVAGIGNAYSDEALHRAKISPYTAASKLTDQQITELFDAIMFVFNEAVERGKDLAINELKPDKKSNMAVHGKTGQPCPVCGDVIREVSFASKSWQYCATCQTGGKVLADRRMSRLLK